MPDEQYALITGASSGLGRSLAFQLAKHNFPLVLVGRNRTRLESIAAELKVPKLAIAADISQRAAVENIFDQAKTKGWKPKFVINCAGAGVFGKLGTFTDESIQKALSGSLVGTILISQRGFVEMRETGGYIVNVMSTASNVARLDESVYCAAKWGARGFTECLRLESKGTAVRVVAVYPGGMNTPFWSEDTGKKTDPSKFMDPDEVASLIVNNLLANSLHVSDIVIQRTS